MSEIATIDFRRIAESVARIREQIEKACYRSARDPGDVTLLAVTKTFPIEAVDAASAAGIRHFGENRVQELEAKKLARPGTYQGGDIFWHLIGPLQRNKIKKAIAVMDCFQALDSLKLARELEKRLEQEDRLLPCHVQVNVSGEESKSGVDPGDAVAFIREVAAFDHLEITGLMTLAAPVEDPEEVRAQFQTMKGVFERAREVSEVSNSLRHLSMGMSGDFVVAIEEGATEIRIGSAIFGKRES